jgi:hypothetical protein
LDILELHVADVGLLKHSTVLYDPTSIQPIVRFIIGGSR